MWPVDCWPLISLCWTRCHLNILTTLSIVVSTSFSRVCMCLIYIFVVSLLCDTMTMMMLIHEKIMMIKRNLVGYADFLLYLMKWFELNCIIINFWWNFISDTLFVFCMMMIPGPVINLVTVHETVDGRKGGGTSWPLSTQFLIPVYKKWI